MIPAGRGMSLQIISGLRQNASVSSPKQTFRRHEDFLSADYLG
jgi:hypothetical protein